MSTSRVSIIPAERIERLILVIRGKKIILDEDLAALYGVATKVLNQAVSRNVSRFPDDFMFRLSKEEFDILRSQSVTARSWGGRRYLPRVFTEHGVLMLSNVLRSRRAVEVSIAVVRAFVRLREIIASHEDLARKLQGVERKYDKRFAVVFDAIRKLMKPVTKEEKRREIGFRP